MSSTYTVKNNPCLRRTNGHSQFVSFSHPSPNRTSSTCLSHNNPAHGCPQKFRPRGTTGSSICAQDFGRLCRGTRIHTCGHSNLRMLEQSGSILHLLPWCMLTRRQLFCPSQSGSLSLTSIHFAAVICDADEPCSVNAAYEPESSSFTMSPRSTTRPLYF